jgi:nucleoside-diphosphate-sugar epimerase
MQAGDHKVLVTGASGFYGRHLVPFLRATGYEPVAMARRDISFGNSIKVVKITDIETGVDFARHLDGVETVVHLVGLAHFKPNIPAADYDRVNRESTKRVAQAAKKAGARLIYISSIAAQSGPSDDKILVESGPLAPTTAYGRSKLAAEQEVTAAGGRHVIFRPSVTYGAGVVGNIARLIQFSTGHIPPPFGALRNRRSLLAVENMCQAVRFALETKAAVGQTFLLADPEPISVAEMVRLLREGAGMAGGGLRVPPTVLSALLRLLGRGDLWEKIAGELVVSVEKLKRFGFEWKVETRDGLRALGATSRDRKRKA